MRQGSWRGDAMRGEARRGDATRRAGGRARDAKAQRHRHGRCVLVTDLSLSLWIHSKMLLKIMVSAGATRSGRDRGSAVQ